MKKQKENISYEDLMKVDIRICRILTCVPVEKTDKLFEMTINTGIEGEEPRTVVSGISHQYDPAHLIGKNFPFVLNLEPRKIRGIESQAMIVLADKDDYYITIGQENEDSNIGAIIF